MSSSRDQGGDKHLISSQLPNMKTELQSDEHSSSLTPAQAVQYNVQTLSGSNGPYPQTTGTEASLSPTTYSLPSIPLSPSPSPFTVSSPVPILQQQQQQQNAYSVPESMGPEALGDFAYINNFPEQSVNGTNNNYELQAYPDSFQQTREVRHLNQAFTPQSPAPQPQPQPYLQHQQYQPQPQPQTPYPHPPTIALGAFPEQFNQQSLPPYAGPELVNTAHNEVNAGPSAIPSRSYPALSSPSLSKPIRRRKKSFWIGVAIIGTLIVIAIILIVILTRNRNRQNDSNTNNSNGSHTPVPIPTRSLPPGISTAVPSSLNPRPTPTPSIIGGQISPLPLPSVLPCGNNFCSNYSWQCTGLCTMDSSYNFCMGRCPSFGGIVDPTCEALCENANLCFQGCYLNYDTCTAICKPAP